MERNDLLESVLMQLPAMICILKGPEHVFELVNPPSQEIIGAREVLGKTVREALPELEGQGYFELLDRVYTTRESYVGRAMPASIMRDGQRVELFVDITYLPLINKSNEVEGIISFSYDVTESVKAQQGLAETADRLQQAYEDLEVKVKFRNLELEQQNLELQKKLDGLTAIK
jgi:PAS domain S-box-containing protein